MEGFRRLRDLKEALSTELEKRPVAERQRAMRTKKQSLLLLMDSGAELDPDALAEIIRELRESGRLPDGPCALVDLGADSSVI